MPNPTFRIKCKINGEDRELDITTHGNKSIHPDLPIIRTKEQAIAHIKRYAKTHEFVEEDGSVRYVAHIDGNGDEHIITDIGECTIVEKGQEKRANIPGQPTATDVAAIIKKL